ncbi:hypothetical protein ACFPOI_29350 [Nonomuraea angiospora]|nr:hypothetical protein [Nonomuraea angiospora]
MRSRSMPGPVKTRCWTRSPMIGFQSRAATARRIGEIRSQAAGVERAQTVPDDRGDLAGLPVGRELGGGGGDALGEFVDVQHGTGDVGDGDDRRVRCQMAEHGGRQVGVLSVAAVQGQAGGVLDLAGKHLGGWR